MEFEEVYKNYNKIIHYLLNHYHITYNYDEFYQLLLIKMWQLTLNYDEQKSTSISTYLFTRLKYHLIDHFRKENNRSNQITLDTYFHNSCDSTILLNDFNLVLEDFSDQLKPQEAQWLRLHIQGFKQYEIAQHMNLSLTSIKKIKNSTKRKCLNNLK
ncbi:sigma-70 family RNA polymerase sigma factor [Staphylococcus capitis]|uniref:sigma-70 family RNA polymerase sigma factor n=1 Tax=Staphylococcus capitis TaxID=29388 RepID=UPI0018871106|nr:sigma-70 family RNA polymerase sigma factor [Staphylococcus capitis]MBF2261435.1 sigma-70 family RNA polymerase sigma factor [Staphylococcus capitis]MBF2282469.1 sigma-70 family RNA polymerase sigma factor [Staphylococcus capitis]